MGDQWWNVELVTVEGRVEWERVKADLHPSVENGDLVFSYGLPTFPECAFARGTWRRFYQERLCQDGEQA